MTCSIPPARELTKPALRRRHGGWLGPADSEHRDLCRVGAFIRDVQPGGFCRADSSGWRVPGRGSSAGLPRSLAEPACHQQPFSGSALISFFEPVDTVLGAPTTGEDSRPGNIYFLATDQGPAICGLSSNW